MHYNTYIYIYVYDFGHAGETSPKGQRETKEIPLVVKVIDDNN